MDEAVAVRRGSPHGGVVGGAVVVEIDADEISPVGRQVWDRVGLDGAVGLEGVDAVVGDHVAVSVPVNIGHGVDLGDGVAFGVEERVGGDGACRADPESGGRVARRLDDPARLAFRRCRIGKDEVVVGACAGYLDGGVECAVGVPEVDARVGKVSGVVGREEDVGEAIPVEIVVERSADDRRGHDRGGEWCGEARRAPERGGVGPVGESEHQIEHAVLVDVERLDDSRGIRTVGERDGPACAAEGAVAVDVDVGGARRGECHEQVGQAVPVVIARRRVGEEMDPVGPGVDRDGVVECEAARAVVDVDLDERWEPVAAPLADDEVGVAVAFGVDRERLVESI